METEKMYERQELLNKLHSMPFQMYLTMLTNEYCLEVNVISAKGTRYEWIGYDDFHLDVYCLNGISKNKVAAIKERILTKSLYRSDFNRTQIKRILPSKDDKEELSGLFVNFLGLPDKKLEAIYCYKSPETGFIYVGDEPEILSDILNEEYPVDNTWEDLSDEQLLEYVEEYEGRECEIPCTFFE